MPTGALPGKGTFWLLPPSVVYRESCFCSVSDGHFRSCVRHLQLHNLGILIILIKKCRPLPGQGCSRTAGVAPVVWGGQSQHSLLQAGEIQVNLKWKLLPSWRSSRLSVWIKHWWHWDGKKRGRNCCFFSSESCSLGLSAYPRGEIMGKFLSREKGIGNGCSYSLQLWCCRWRGWNRTEREAWYPDFLALSIPCIPYAWVRKRWIPMAIGFFFSFMPERWGVTK